MDTVFDLGRIVAVTDLKTTSAWRTFAVLVANVDQVHKFEGKTNTNEAVRISKEHVELIEAWRFFVRDFKTFGFNRDTGPLIHKLRNYQISVMAVTAVEGIEPGDEGTLAFKVHFSGRAMPLIIGAKPEKRDALKAEHDELCAAWGDVFQTFPDEMRKRG